MKNKKLIIFDFDGVIIDSYDHAYEGNTRTWPNLTHEQHKAIFNGNIYTELNKIISPKYSSKEHHDWWLKEHAPKKKSLPIFKGMAETLRNLSKRYQLVINTSSDQASTKEFLEINKANYFDAIYGVEISKDKIKRFKQILSDYKISRKDCLFITDTAGDVRDAIGLSIPTLVVTWGYQNRGHFSQVEKQVIGFADKPSDILKFLNPCASIK